MDFRSLARRDLQFLCKKNRIPANQTNAAMANALQALETVEGIEEFQEALGFQSHKKSESKSPEIPPTSQRASSRRSIYGDKPKIQEQLTSSLPRSRRVTVKATEVIEMASKEDEGEKKEARKLLPKTPATNRRTSREQEASIVTPKTVHTGRTRLAKRIVAETPKVVEAKEGRSTGVMTRRGTGLSSRKAVEEKTTTKVESRSSSSSIKAKEAVKMSSLANEGAEEEETEDEKKASAENDESSVLLVEDAGKKDQEVKIHGISSSLDVENSKVEVFKSPEEEDGENNQETETHGLPSLLHLEEEADGKELVDASPLRGEIGWPEENPTKVEESNISNEAFAFVKDSREQTSTDEILKESSCSKARGTISYDTEAMLSYGVEKDEEEKLALLFTEMTLKEAAESGDALPEAEIVQDASLILTYSTSETDFVEETSVTDGDGCLTETNDTDFPKDADKFIASQPAVVAPDDAPLDFKNLDAVSDLREESLVTEGVSVSFASSSESPNIVKEIAGEQASEIPVTEDSIDREFEESVAMPHETETLQEEAEETGSNLTGEILEVPPQEACGLAAREIVDLPPQESESSRGTSFTATVGGSTAESADEGKVIEETIELIEKTEILQDASFERQISAPSTEDSSAVIITETFVGTEKGADDSTNEEKGSEGDVCSTETMPLSEFSKVVQIQSTDSEVADQAVFEMTEEKEETKAVETHKSFEDQNITAEVSLSELNVMHKQKLGEESKNEVGIVEEKWDENKYVRENKSVKDERLVDLSLTKLRAMYKQKLDDRKNEMERSKSVNSMQKLNDDRIKLGRRTPLKNLN